MHKIKRILCSMLMVFAMAVPQVFAQAFDLPDDRASVPQFYLYFTADLEQLDLYPERYDVAIWHHHPNLLNALPAFREGNPKLKAFMYKELFAILQVETEANESIGNYDWIDQNHPEWFQLDTEGNRIEIPEYPGRWMMDMGNASFREFWIEETLDDVLEGNWDGVFVDDALTNVDAHSLPPLQNYLTDEALQDAVYGFLVRIKEVFSGYDKLVMANVSSTYHFPGLFDKWIGVLDGMMEEHFAGEGWTWGDTVAQQQIEAMLTARAQGKWYFAMTYGDWEAKAKIQQSLAAYLIGAGENTYWAYRPYFEFVHSPQDPDWTFTLGEPLDEPIQTSGLWKREFEKGTVFLNSQSTLAQVSLTDCKLNVGPHSWMIKEPGDSCQQPEPCPTVECPEPDTSQCPEAEACPPQPKPTCPETAGDGSSCEVQPEPKQEETSWWKSGWDRWNSWRRNRRSGRRWGR